MNRKKQAGLSLLEVVIAMLIMSMILLLTFRILMTSTDASATGSVTGDLEFRGNKFLDDFKAQYRYCKVVAVAVDGTGRLRGGKRRGGGDIGEQLAPERLVAPRLTSEQPIDVALVRGRLVWERLVERDGGTVEGRLIRREDLA